ncbi:hypothetical protein CcaverHIS002_0506080 [Cutaneotrichosporon cavernicola]|uniref:DUF7729 domain-containing protein n=1 Tax=Cutaneotrichosporon cavernicola TaxID=279322 RepID=A0AA48QX57_9TREE|nr:uncharacterized protein CcaverHIS019_0506610 [Cutaneotrichosporon cavernicola]BEI85207.1 hypothetical protein CcaverHIS002_0506080 [Cutaneotrichosporon cavernicola]BEI93033.1 hypothetical protein CcaverHIS019_0506610 [Cutaneotrichosporon cavernicola]BEJ00809.1 hypothetical protein CcaverHIS631_0506660 [Cutaneotrichosporon cavernicola]BEJ08576.1 hypothetical protein CcaverHIS641_0506700 [Cutaneotrichosporon cavernicola]
MKLSAAALLLASTAFGASSSLIPSGISSGCTTFLESLNADQNLQTCVNPLIQATNAFSPVSGKNPSSSDLTSALKTMCSASGCDQSYVVGKLNEFYSACRSEIDSGNSKVAELYDVLYVFTPLKGAVCSVDSGSQAYCVNSIRKAGASSNPGPAGSKSFASSVNAVAAIANSAADYLYNAAGFSKRAASQSFASVVTPNATTYRNTNLPFLFLQPDMTKDQLCTSCTRQIMVNYIKYENGIVYGPGLSNSPILGGQSGLWNGIKTVCGDAFTGAIVTEAGGSLPSSNALSRAAVPAVGLVAGVAALVFVL